MVPQIKLKDLDRLERTGNKHEQQEFLAAIAAHELREPTQAIMSFLNVVLQGAAGPLTDVQRDFLSTANVATRRLKRRIDDLQLILAGDGELKLNLRQVDLSEHVVTCVHELAEIARSYDVSIQTHLEVSRGAVILADPDRLDQVILNLLENAIQYAAAGTSVMVYLVKSDAGAWCVAIRNTVDEAPAVDPEAWFVAFDRGFTARSAQHSGSGLGLTAVEYLVRAQGGHVMARADGSQVYFGVIFGRPDQAQGGRFETN